MYVNKYDLPVKTPIHKKLDAIIFLFGSQEFIIFLFGSQEFTKSEYLDIASAENIDIFLAKLYLKQLTNNAELSQVYYDKYKNDFFL
jgi:hypothetical protein